jgi:hypothetical protein
VIPKILHRCVPEVVPDRYAEFWDRFCAMHPDWQHVTWQDPLNPDDWELGFLFDRCTAGAQLAGLVRLEVGVAVRRCLCGHGFRTVEAV